MELRLNLTDDERLLLVQMLQREQQELHSQRRRAQTTEVRDDLRDRADLVDRLLARLAEVATPAESETP